MPYFLPLQNFLAVLFAFLLATILGYISKFYWISRKGIWKSYFFMVLTMPIEMKSPFRF